MPRLESYRVHPQPARRLAIRFIVAFLAILVSPALAQEQGTVASRSVPAEYERRLSLPGALDQFLRPTSIFADRSFGEILVADSGHNRVIIFDENGTYRFEFGNSDDFATPSDVAVDSSGYIYVLGSTTQGKRLNRYDFDGTSPTAIPLPGEADGANDFRSLAIDHEDLLYVLEAKQQRVFVMTKTGTLENSFVVAEDLEAEERRELVTGSITVSGDHVFVPASSFGTVYVYTRHGEFVRHLGYRGNLIGELNFPVAVAVTSDDLVLVLDKHRFNVLCFSISGKFLGEFGGKGISPGWFYHPSLLALDANERVYVGQIFDNRIEVCRIPAFIRDAHARAVQQDAALSTMSAPVLAGTPSVHVEGRGRIE